jgi:hypothetical protein
MLPQFAAVYEHVMHTTKAHLDLKSPAHLTKKPRYDQLGDVPRGLPDPTKTPSQDTKTRLPIYRQGQKINPASGNRTYNLSTKDPKKSQISRKKTTIVPDDDIGVTEKGKSYNSKNPDMKLRNRLPNGDGVFSKFPRKRFRKPPEQRFSDNW